MLCFWEMAALLPNDEPELQLPKSDPSKRNLCSEHVALLPLEAMTAAIGSQKAFLTKYLLRITEIKERFFFFFKGNKDL